jgi:hypothetical protein
VAINFPTSLDNFTNPVSGNTLDSPSHSLQHSDINDAVEAMQRKVGVGTAVAGSASAGQVLTISAAGTSTWSTPTVPALVQIVPTSMAVGSGSGSFDANGRITFTAASSISLNGIFSATYNSYRIIFDTTSTTDGRVDFNLTTGGTLSTTGYYRNGWYIDNAGNGYWYNGQNQTYGVITDHAKIASSMDIYRPFLADTTRYTALSAGLDTGTGNQAVINGGLHNVATSYDGIKYAITSGTMTGTISVYGYR